MSMVAVQDLRELAADIAEEAGHLALRRRAEGFTLAATKTSVADIVTEADREVEELIRERLRVERPGDGFLGEESGAAHSETGITWIVDPIDGTVNYAYGLPNYNVSIAAVSGEVHPDRWEALAAAVYAPAMSEMFTAAAGEGAVLGTRRLHVSEVGPAGALLGTGFGYDPSTHDGDIATVRRVMTMARDVRRLGAAALDLAYVAAGRLDGYFERGLKPWDLAAGVLLVREAGGQVSRLETAAERPMVIAGSEDVYRRLRTILEQ